MEGSTSDARVAVITGAGRGIGRALAVRLAAEGATVVVSSRTRSDLDAVVASIEGSGGSGHVVVADALDREQAKRPVVEAVERFGRIDVVVNNVGGAIGADHDPFTGSDDTFERTLTMNLTSAWWTTRAALPHMRAHGWGRVVFIGSGASKSSTPGGRPAYTAAKHGLVGLTKQLARAGAPYGITVNCVCPGWTNTSLVDWDAIAARQGVSVEQAQQVALDANVQRRILEPEELCGLVALLCGDEGGGMTGQVMSVDGGYGI
jgi:NAD(P)-dependent dehydrogenase (short-subunit alcohol dehydrogenase family)